MSDVYFKASLQNTLNPEVGTFDNVDNKEGIFTLKDGEYYLTNNTSDSYRVYYPTKDIIYSVGFTTVEFDINYRSNGSSLNSWCLLFNGSDAAWHGFGCSDSTLYFLSNNFNYEIVTSPSTWLHVKCIFDYNYDLNQNIVHIYINNVEVKNFTISNIHDIKYIDILGNSEGFVANAKIKNITIRNSKKHYLDIIGLTSLWSKIKSLFATKTELASKANTSDLSTVATSGSYNDLLDKPTPFDGDLSNYYTKSEVDNLLSNIGSGTEGGDDAQNVLKSWPDGPEAHNAMWGGRDITADFDAGTVSEHIADGTFKDIFPGDYITKQVTISRVLADDGTTVLFDGGTYTVNWVIADCDYWWHKGDQDNGMGAHHVVIVPQTPIFDTWMNNTNTTKGGYAGSEMYKNVIPACATGIVNAFGSDHILTFNDVISNSVDTAHVSSGIPQWTGTPVWPGEWVSVQCNLMSEKMVFGAPVCSAGAMDNAMATRQMSAFRLSERLINYNRGSWWLRDVVSSALFATVGFSGNADPSDASNAGGVRPFALLV